MKLKYSSLLIGLLLPLTFSTADDSLIPPNAKAGECYAKVVVPAKYETFEEKVLVKEASEKITIVPAKYEWKDEKVEVTPASKKIIPVPAKYKKVVETIEVKPATRVWQTSIKKNGAPVSKEILVAAKLKGVDLDGTTPNSCYKEYFTPERFKTVTEEIVVQNEANKTEIIPAKYEMVEKTIEVSPAAKKTIEVPATYEFKEERILVEKEKTVWKKGANPAQKLDGATGEIMCLVKVPAVYKTIKKKVVKTPATTKVIEVPAVSKTINVKKLISEAEVKKTTIPAIKKSIEKKVLETKSDFIWNREGEEVEKGWNYTGHKICLVEKPALTKQITKTVLDTPATTKEVAIEATYKTMKVKKLVEEAKEVKTPIDAEYKMVKKRKKVSDAKQDWERILCQTNMNKDVILKIQNALKAKEYNPGKLDGVLGRDTRVALDKFQRDNSLATGGITYETLNALKIGL
ncbi:MAG: peptidoglycan-binding protein [Epsilonproteobacteria bacterium]|nr:peptidoglycan-binding protein [Campylobacterota bacterium]